MVELFEACQQQVSDLERKERVRARLQQEIQRVYAGERERQPVFLRDFPFLVFLFPPLLAVARLYLTGSSMNGLGCRSSDADLCLVIRGMVNIDRYGA